MVQKEEQKTIDDALELTEDHQLEKEEILKEGFGNWNKREFAQFVRLNEKYGRKAVASIGQEVEGKTEETVVEYSKVFWERHGELQDSEKILAQVSLVRMSSSFIVKNPR